MSTPADLRSLDLARHAIEQAVSALRESFDPVRIAVFGSYARGTATRHSDLDLLVVLDEAPDKRSLAVQMRRVLADLPCPKDIVVTTPAEIAERGSAVGSILRPALREGVTVYERAT